MFWNFISRIAFALLSLRYKIRVKGQDLLKESGFAQKGGVLFLPNHPAHMDPLFLFLLLWPKYRMRPLVIEYIYRLPILKGMIRLVKALPIPSFDTSVNPLKIKRAEASIQAIADGLKRGENFVLYPGARLKNTGKEILGGSSGAHAIVEEYPGVRIVLVRTTGLWGSSFSRAILGRSPDLPKTLLAGFKTLLKNFLFFAPRREVLIEIEPEPKGIPRGRSRLEFNRFLESWYNRYVDKAGKVHEIEPATLVSYAFWKNEVPEVYTPKRKKTAQGVAVSRDIQTKIYEEIRKIVDNPGIEIAPEKNLAIDLGMDSLNIAELITFLTQNYEVDELHPEDIETVQHVLEVAEGARDSEHPTRELGSTQFTEEPKRPSPVLPVGRTIPEAFLNAAERMSQFTCMGDDLAGIMSYKKLKRSAIVLATHFRKMPDQKIAVLLPASVGAFVVILALQLAGKTPVMLNWTLGPRYLEEMMHLSGAKKVLSSWRFLDKLSHVEFGNLIDSMLLLEDIRAELGLKTKLKGALLSLLGSRRVLKSFQLDQVHEDDPAVVLFTSGTEASPKGVPLSHKNIISNLRSAMQCIDLRSKDILYGILPPFHSFGFSIAGLFPILAGIKVAFYPDPTDSFALAAGIERWKVTIFCGAPSFLKGLFHAAKKDQLKTVRYFVSGAEKAPPELFERIAKLGTGAKLIEGYGITECSPVLTINRPNLPPNGVGRILPDVELCTIHPETLKLLEPHAEGEICVRGPNIFEGYLGNPRTPFIEIEGKQWYRTGDIGYLDPKGNLILSGRLKRFTKLGGEMISLYAVESVLIEELLKKGLISSDIPSIAIIADEKEAGKPLLILFTTISIDREAINEILKNSGISRLVKISSIRKIEEIPMMGTGKTNYRALQALVDAP